MFSTFLKLLDESRGDFLRSVSDRIAGYVQEILRGSDLSRKYIFENMDGTSLKQEPFDSSRFVEFCESEEVPLVI